MNFFLVFLERKWTRNFCVMEKIKKIYLPIFKPKKSFAFVIFAEIFHANFDDDLLIARQKKVEIIYFIFQIEFTVFWWIQWIKNFDFFVSQMRIIFFDEFFYFLFKWIESFFFFLIFWLFSVQNFGYLVMS